MVATHILLGIVDICLDHSEGGNQGELADTDRVVLTVAQQAAENNQVLVERVKHQEVLNLLQVTQSLK